MKHIYTESEIIIQVEAFETHKNEKKKTIFDTIINQARIK